MLITVLIVFILASVTLELSLVSRSKLIRHLVKRHHFVGVTLSVGLSWLLGALFAAGGMIVLVGSVASSAITAPIYALMVRWRRWYATWSRLRRHLITGMPYIGLPSSLTRRRQP